MWLTNKKLDGPTNVSDLAQRVRSLVMAQTDTNAQMEFLPVEPLPVSNTPLKTSTVKRGSFDQLDIPYIDEDGAQT